MFIIIAAAMIAGIGAFCFCEFVAIPQYSAKGSIMVTNGAIISTENIIDDDFITNTDVQASLSLAPSVAEMLNTNEIFKNLSDEIDGKYSYSYLSAISSISRRSNNSLFIDVSFTANTREEAISLVNTYLDLAPEYIKNSFKKSEISTFKSDSAGMVYPRTLFTTAVAGVIGALIAYAILFLIYCANSVIKGEDDFKDRFDIPVLGCIPDFSANANAKYYKNYNYGKGGKTKDGK